ncbi:hypothetical protein SALWKB12_0738 [Snodgrassella communis]|uniref:Uncharacterized protein n=1 Tax=Snodgrassella communis TaxID=2946699 RepID=A0A836MRH2_9NEIS|nr:hypothetical protein SALWKB12_0738 [Snodgrassella communis]KDN15239.1 hypothetical protein SALWKB29_0865 [Snodgrassella communis]
MQPHQLKIKPGYPDKMIQQSHFPFSIITLQRKSATTLILRRYKPDF